VITIPETAMAACGHCWLSICVNGYATGDFSVVVTVQDTRVELTDGVPQYGAVKAGGYQVRGDEG
jgi:hypothetical protein